MILRKLHQQQSPKEIKQVIGLQIDNLGARLGEQEISINLNQEVNSNENSFGDIKQCNCHKTVRDLPLLTDSDNFELSSILSFDPFYTLQLGVYHQGPTSAISL